jgi:hypothetical protein
MCPSLLLDSSTNCLGYLDEARESARGKEVLAIKCGFSVAEMTGTKQGINIR